MDKEKLMHIAFLTPEYPHPKVTTTAGIGTTVMNLAEALVQEGVLVSVFVYGQRSEEVFVENEVKIHLIPSKKYKIATWYYYRKFLQEYINRYTQDDQIDLIEAPDWTGITAFMKLKAPLVIRFHGTDAYFCYLERRRQKFKNFLLEKLGIQKADAYLSPSQYTAKITKDIFGITNKPIVVIPSGLPLERFHNATPEAYEKGLILYMGTIIRKKGVLELAPIFEKVLQQCPESQLMIIGGDSYDLKTRSDSTWLLLQNALNGSTIARVKYLGRIPYHQIQDYIRRANVCVFPTFAETQGMVTIEAMAMSKAVVNSNMDWAREVIEPGKSGFLADPRNHEAFAECIVKIIRDENLNQQLGHAAREKVVTDFDIKVLVKKNIAFYRTVINEKE